MLLVIFVLICLAPLAVAITWPAWQAAEPAWTSSLIMTGLGLMIIFGMVRWSRFGQGAKVARVLGWRYTFLIITSIAVTTTLTVLFLFAESEIGNTGIMILICEMALLQFVCGLASIIAPRNRLLGFRSPRTLLDDEAWRIANQRWGRLLMIVSPLALVGLVAGSAGLIVAMLPALIVGIAFLVSDWR